MNIRSLIILAICTILTSTCNTDTNFSEPTPTFTATSVAGLLHFENDLVAFDYPEGTRIFSAGDPTFVTYPYEIQLGGDLVVGLANPHWIKSQTLFSSIGIFRHALPPGSNLDEVMQAAYEDVPLQNEATEVSGAITIHGLTGYQKTYRVASGPLWYTLRDIWIKKEGGVWRISMWEEAYAMDFQPLLDIFLSSLEIMENLPPYKENLTPESEPSSTPFPASMIRHFENEAVSFDYPKRMRIFNACDPAFACYPDFQLGGELVAGLGDPKFIIYDKYYRSIRIFRQPIPTGFNLESIMLEAYRLAETRYPQKNGELKAPGHVTIDGLIAVQRTYRVYSGEPAFEMRDVWLQKDNELFIVSIWTRYTNPEDLAAFQAGADLLLNSLRIK